MFDLFTVDNQNFVSSILFIYCGMGKKYDLMGLEFYLFQILLLFIF